MDESVFSGYGIEILKRGGRYFVRYDAGEIVIQPREDEITEEQALRAQRSEEDAYEVILNCQNMKR